MTSANDPVALLKVRCPGCGQKLDLTHLAPFSLVFCPTCGDKLTVPMEFGAYLLEEMLGAGPHATVYRALDRTLEREVAVKTLGDRVRADSALTARYLEAARRAAGITHSGIIPIYACDDTPAHPYLVMQYMSGLSLARAFERQPEGMPVAEAVRLFAGVAGGLAAAADRQLLHLNLHPGNILLDAEGSGKVGDFGLAMVLWDSRNSLVVNRHRCHPVTRYLSPEQLRTGQADLRGDMFSLGAILYQALTGRAPFPEAHADGSRDRLPAGQSNPAARRPEVPPALGSLVAGLLAEEPADRPQAWVEVTAVLERLNKGYKRPRTSAPPSPVAGKKKGIKRTFRVQTPVTTPPVAGARPASQPVLRGWGTLVAVLVVAVVVAGLAVGAALRPSWYTRGIEPVLLRLFHQPLPAAGAPATGLAAPPPPPAAGGDAWLAGEDAGGAGAAEPPGSAAAWSATPQEEGAATAAAPEAAEATVPATPPPVITGADGRPMPADLDFFREKDALKQYVRSLPPEEKTRAIETVREISILRDYLVSLFRFMPYEDRRGAGIRLRDGSVLHGSVMGNAREILIRPANGKYRRRAWHDLEFEQFVTFFDYYTRCRIDKAPAGIRGRDARHDAAADQFRVALLCDWYGRPDQAAAHARQAAELDPSLRERLGKLLPNTTF
ncbi:MAG: serine/threonine-protein kinase [Lentisphaeria bacterium]